MNINKAPSLDYNEDNSEAIAWASLESAQPIESPEAIQSEIELPEALQSEIESPEDKQSEVDTPSDNTEPLIHEKSDAASRFRQIQELKTIKNRDLVENLDQLLETYDTDLMVEKIFNETPRLNAYQIISKYDTLEKHGINIDINDYLDNPKGISVPHEVVARNIDYLIERGARFNSLLHKLSANEVIENIDKLMKMDGADIAEVEARLLIHKPGPSLAQKYMEALQPYR